MKLTLTSTLIASGIALAALSSVAQAVPPTRCVNPKPKLSATNMT